MISEFLRTGRSGKELHIFGVRIFLIFGSIFVRRHVLERFVAIVDRFFEVGWLVGWLVGWSVGRLVGWLVGSLECWLVRILMYRDGLHGICNFN